MGFQGPYQNWRASRRVLSCQRGGNRTGLSLHTQWRRVLLKTVQLLASVKNLQAHSVLGELHEKGKIFIKGMEFESSRQGNKHIDKSCITKIYNTGRRKSEKEKEKN